MSKKAKLSLREKVAKKWESIREHHLTIMTTIFVISLVMMLFTLVFVMNGTYTELTPEMNALAWLSGLIGIIVAIFLWPEFFFLRGRYNSLKEFMQISSPSELRKEMADAQEAAKILGDRYQDKLQEFLLEKGIRMKRKSK
jgi:cytochrome c biogenesis protein CcdA|tara:strand:+ start:216 stop:638 length:423 start_codon:yes stop_codon:yes gene_type:complete